MPPIVILGMHRSGTSLIAGLCQRLGVNIGTVLRVGDRANPDGYFEDLDWRALNKWLINTAGGTWYDPPSRAEVSRQAHRLEPIIRALIEWKSKGTWGFKDPRTCLTIHALHEHFADPRYVIARRPTEEIVDSLVRRSEVRGYKELRQHWVALTEQYLASICRFQESHDLKLMEIHYHLILDRKTAGKQLVSLADFLNLPQANVDRAMELIRFNDL